jgi:hypothetical protein
MGDEDEHTQHTQAGSIGGVALALHSSRHSPHAAGAQAMGSSLPVLFQMNGRQHTDCCLVALTRFESRTTMGCVCGSAPAGIATRHATLAHCVDLVTPPPLPCACPAHFPMHTTRAASRQVGRSVTTPSIDLLPLMHTGYSGQDTCICCCVALSVRRWTRC